MTHKGWDVWTHNTHTYRHHRHLRCLYIWPPLAVPELAMRWEYTFSRTVHRQSPLFMHPHSTHMYQKNPTVFTSMMQILHSLIQQHVQPLSWIFRHIQTCIYTSTNMTSDGKEQVIDQQYVLKSGIHCLISFIFSFPPYALCATELPWLELIHGTAKVNFIDYKRENNLTPDLWHFMWSFIILFSFPIMARTINLIYQTNHHKFGKTRYW